MLDIIDCGQLPVYVFSLWPLDPHQLPIMRQRAGPQAEVRADNLCKINFAWGENLALYRNPEHDVVKHVLAERQKPGIANADGKIPTLIFANGMKSAQGIFNLLETKVLPSS